MSSNAVACVRSTCPIANVLDLVGDRWSLLVLRDTLIFGLHEFKEFLRAGEGIASNILSARLKALVAADLLAVVPHPTNRVKRLYYATARAKELLPMLLEMVRWANAHAPAAEVPVDTIQAIERDRDAFIVTLREQLEDWEHTHLEP